MPEAPLFDRFISPFSVPVSVILAGFEQKRAKAESSPPPPHTLT